MVKKRLLHSENDHEATVPCFLVPYCTGEETRGFRYRVGIELVRILVVGSVQAVDLYGSTFRW
jgi:hypothetical protein